MIDPKSLKLQLSGLAGRAAQRADVERWGAGELSFLPTEILPDISEAVRATIVRLAATAQSIGPRIVNTVKFGTIGSVNWGGDNSALDSLIELQDLEGLAEDILERGLYSGVLEGVVRRSESGEVRLEPILGYTEPVFAADSPTEVIGYIHAWLEPDTTASDPKWVVRVYDLLERTLHEQRGLRSPERFDYERATVVGPTAEYPDGAPTPDFLIVNRSRSRLPRGYLAHLLPLIKGDWVSQVRGDRSEEATAFPQLLLRGEFTSGTNERSPTHILTTDKDGDARFLEPGDLAQIHAHHDRKLERIREDANMPGGFLGNDSPSGEALREANAKFINLCRWYANRLSRILTRLAQRLAAANGLQADVQVVVEINREFEKENEVQRILMVYREGLMDFGAAVRALSVFFPTWESKDLEAFIEREEALANPEPRPSPDGAEVAAV